jgi:hypothetical protein
MTTSRSTSKLVTAANTASRLLFGAARVKTYRWVKSRIDLRRLAAADVAFVSYAKAGRTWTRVMISRLYQLKYGLPAEAIIERDNLHRMNGKVPVFLFTMGNYIAERYPIGAAPSPYDTKKLIFLARHPADTAVSFHFHLNNRIPGHLRDLKRLPQNTGDLDVFAQLQQPRIGLGRVIDYMNAWAPVLARHPRHLRLRYEDLQSDPVPQLKALADFLGEEFTDEQYAEAVDFASFDKLKQKEAGDFFGNSRLQAGDVSNPDSYKVRRGKVGGYRDYLSPEQIAWVDDEVTTKLDPSYGYQSLEV